MISNPIFTVSARLLVPLLFALAALLAIGGSYRLQVSEYSESVRHNEQKRLRERLGVEQSRIEAEWGMGNRLQVRRLVSALALHSGVTDAWLLDRQGIVAAALSRTELGKPIQSVLNKRGADFLGAIGEKSQPWHADIQIFPVEAEPVLLAEVGIHPDMMLLVRLDLSLALTERMAMSRSHFWWQAAMILLLTMLLAGLLHVLWFRRAAQLTATALALEGGDFNVRARMQGGDELARIGMALDGMARGLQHYRNELRQGVRHLETVANASPALFWTSGLDKGCNWFNHRWLDFTGRSMAQEQGNGWAEGVHPDDFERCLQIYTTAFDMRQPFSMEYRLRRHDGEYRWLLDQGMPRYDADGRFLGFIGSCLDVTEQRQLNDRLAASEAHYRYLFEQNPAPMLIYQRAGLQLVSVNEAFLRRYGYSNCEALALCLPDLYPESEKAAIIEMAQNQLGHTCAGEWHHRLKSGEFIDVVAHSHDLLYNGQDCRVAVMVDITALKRAELTLQQRNEELERFNAASVGRELVMIDLKREINRLSVQLGQERPFDLEFVARGDG